MRSCCFEAKLNGGRDKVGESRNIWNPVFTNAFVINVLTTNGTFMMNSLSAKYADYLSTSATIVSLDNGDDFHSSSALRAGKRFDFVGGFQKVRPALFTANCFDLNGV